MRLCARELITAGVRVAVVVADEVELLTWEQQSGPRQRRRVTQLGVVVDKHEAAADAAQRTQAKRLNVERLHSQRKHTPTAAERMRKDKQYGSFT